MKFKSSFLLLLVCLSLILSACSDPNAGWVPAGMKLASTEAVDYTMYVPESWTVDVSTGIVSAYVSVSDRSNVTMTAFNLGSDDLYISLDEYWERYQGDLIATFPDICYTEAEVISPAETTADGETIPAETAAPEHPGYPISTVMDNTAANKYYYTATVTGVTYKFMQLVSIRAGIAYVMTYTSTPDMFDEHIEEIDKIIEYFKFE